MYPDAAPAPIAVVDGDNSEMAVDAPEDDGEPRGVIVHVLKDCLNELKEPDARNAKPAVKIVATATGSSGARSLAS